jgi:hypothetical protein
MSGGQGRQTIGEPNKGEINSADNGSKKEIDSKGRDTDLINLRLTIIISIVKISSVSSNSRFTIIKIICQLIWDVRHFSYLQLHKINSIF